MPAKARFRINEAGIYSHIYNRGIESRDIFNDEEDYSVFLGYLQDYLSFPKDRESAKKTFKINGRSFQGVPHQPKNYFNDVELAAYSLKPNHFHLILHQKKSDSQEKFIRSLCTRYSMYFNKKYKRSGPLFEGPYKYIPLKDDIRLLPYLTRFLHHNGSYSSYREFLSKKQASWISAQAILLHFKMNPASYKHFVENKNYDEKEKELIDLITFPSDIECLERSDLASSSELSPFSRKKSAPKALAFWGGSLVIFLLLVNLSVRNIIISMESKIQSMRIQAQSKSAPRVLGAENKPPQLPAGMEVRQDFASASESAEVAQDSLDSASESAEFVQNPQITEGIPAMVVVRAAEGIRINIRKGPSKESEIVGGVFDGAPFELISKYPGWYEVKLPEGSIGFIAAELIVEEE